MHCGRRIARRRGSVHTSHASHLWSLHPSEHTSASPRHIVRQPPGEPIGSSMLSQIALHRCSAVSQAVLQSCSVCSPSTSRGSISACCSASTSSLMSRRLKVITPRLRGREQHNTEDYASDREYRAPEGFGFERSGLGMREFVHRPGPIARCVPQALSMGKPRNHPGHAVIVCSFSGLRLCPIRTFCADTMHDDGATRAKLARSPSPPRSASSLSTASSEHTPPRSLRWPYPEVGTSRRIVQPTGPSFIGLISPSTTKPRFS